MIVVTFQFSPSSLRFSIVMFTTSPDAVVSTIAVLNRALLDLLDISPSQQLQYHPRLLPNFRPYTPVHEAIPITSKRGINLPRICYF